MIIQNDWNEIISIEWNCMPGQGGSSHNINHIRKVSIDSCQRSCMQYDGCIAIDFSDADYFNSGSSCRMYGEDIPRSDPGRDNRIYCTTVFGTK